MSPPISSSISAADSRSAGPSAAAAELVELVERAHERGESARVELLVAVQLRRVATVRGGEQPLGEAAQLGGGAAAPSGSLAAAAAVAAREPSGRAAAASESSSPSSQPSASRAAATVVIGTWRISASSASATSRRCSSPGARR